MSMGLVTLMTAIARSVPGTAAQAAVAAQTAAEAAQDAAETAAAKAETHNYGISVSSNTLVITPPAES